MIYGGFIYITFFEPCGIPQVTVLTLKECPGKLTYRFLFLRNDFNQLLATPRTP